MNLNPLTWLLVLAPAAVIGALLFVWVYQSNSSTADLERDRMRLESMEFDRDAAAAWNGQPLQGPNTEEMDQLRSRINAKESAADAAAAERCQRMADLAARLDTTLQEQGGSAAKATTDPTCKALEVSNAH
ncbi:hypothetical protein ACRTJ0_004596 [Salmonella enterica subsp. enterica serovar Cerro]|nr:hypothetical protein [Salmonella enterica subsp. enterica serovar Anatum]EEF8234037.1 hypothetical protein [Salmonella enterica]EJQ5314487.1 hypothetical protein [Salmonella enterica subsp. enterica serovar Anatum]ELR6776304.1 hypothetical protein [Salmonella enterica]ELR6798810.1 hypothetical protein [Salmonella enterica]